MARIYNIHAPITGLRSWRQADTMTMAVNFYENGYNFFYPQINWGGNTPGYVESEFPIYSYFAALLFSVVGVSELYARLLSIFFSLASIFFFYLLVLDHSDEKTALWACVFISILPLNVYIGRMIMPESLLMLSLVAGCYYFSKWLKYEKMVDFILSVCFIATACLIKIPSLYIGLPLLYLAWIKFNKNIFYQWELWLFSIIIFGSLFGWYYHAHQILLQSDLTFGIWEYGTDKWGNWNLIKTWEYWRRILLTYLGARFFVWFAYPVFFVGLFLKRLTPKEKFFDFWLGAVFIYFIVVGTGNFVHDYYQLPFTFPASFFLGKVYARYFHKEHLFVYLSLFVLLIAITATSAYNYNKIYLQAENPKKSMAYELAECVLENTEENALIIAIDNGDPTFLYLSNRKGWHADRNSIITDDIDISDKIQKGARYLVGNWLCYPESECRELRNAIKYYKVVFKNKKCFIVQLSK